MTNWCYLPHLRPEVVHPCERSGDLHHWTNRVCQFSREEGYAVVRYGSEVLRLAQDFPIMIPQPDYRLGETVLVDGGRYAGVIARGGYHTDRREPMYFLDVDGKRKSRRYFADDLSPNGFKGEQTHG